MSQRSATLQGCLALAIWSISATLMVALKHIPPFQLVALSFGLGSLTIFAFTGFKRPKIDPLLCSLLASNQYCYITAFKWAPVAQVDLLVYLWPLTLLILAGIFLNEKVTIWHIVGSVLGFSGIALLFLRSVHVGTTSLNHLPGYIAAAYCAISWAVISIRLKQQKEQSVTLIGSGCACASLAAGILAFIYEPAMPLEASSFAVILILGIGSSGPSYAFWQKGIMQGHFKFLSMASYATPVLSITWLIVAGYIEPTPTLGISCGMVTLGTCLPNVVNASWNIADASAAR